MGHVRHVPFSPKITYRRLALQELPFVRKFACRKRCNFNSTILECTGKKHRVRDRIHAIPRVVLQSAKSASTRRGIQMLPSLRFAGIITAIFAVCGFATAQEIAPANSGVSIQKLSIDNGGAHTVKYFVTGGSPRLQALVRRVEWAENELSVIEQLQQLKLDTVVNERRVAAFRTTQLTNPFFSPRLTPQSCAWDNGGGGQSYLQQALSEQLADEATPDAALQMIGFLEQTQTQLDAELKALPPQEKKAAQGPIDALRPRVAALARPAVPPPQPQPVAPPVNQGQIRTTGPVTTPQVRLPAPTATQQPPSPQDPVAFQQWMQQQFTQVQQQLTQR
jgi:hypothetical protein